MNIVRKIQEKGSELNAKLESFFPKPNKWLTLLAGILLELGAGNQYGFSIYSTQMKHEMGFKIHEIDSMATSTNIATFWGVLVAIFFDLTGPKPTVLLAWFFIFFGYFSVFLSVVQAIPNVGWVGFCVYYFAIGTGSAAMYYTGISPNIRNFDPKHRGVIVGLLVGCYGLSSSLLGLVYKFFLAKDMTKYLLFLSVVLPFLAFVSFFLVGIDTQKHAKKSASEDDDVHFSELENDNMEDQPQSQQRIRVLGEESNLQTMMLTLPPWKVIQTIDFFLLFFILLCGIGSGLVCINTVHELVISLSGSGFDEDKCNDISASLVVILGVANSFGRLLFGVVSDYSRRVFSRVSFLFLATSLMAIAQLFAAFSSLTSFYGVIFIVGLSYGGMFSMAPSFVSERFGERFFSINWGCSKIGAGIGSLLLATLLQSYFFTRYSEEGAGEVCYGPKCFRYTFLVTTLLCFFASLLALWLRRRSVRFYNDLWLKTKNAVVCKSSAVWMDAGEVEVENV